MKKINNLLKYLSVSLGAIFFLFAFFSETSILQRIECAAFGFVFFLAPWLAFIRHLLFSALGLIFSVLYFSKLPAPPDMNEASIRVAAVGFFLFGAWNTCLLIRDIWQSGIVELISLRRRDPQPLDLEAPLEADEDSNVILRTPADRVKLIAQYTPIREIYTKVAGTTFRNADGTDRQAILSACNTWDEINLEYFTYKGAPAYAVWTVHGQIGNLPADVANLIYNVYSEYVTFAEIKEITGGSSGHYYGCNLTLTVLSKNAATAEPEDLPQSASEPPQIASEPPATHYAAPRKRENPPVNDQFIAEAQWYAARGGEGFEEDE